MSNIEQLRQEGIAARVTWDFGAEALPMRGAEEIRVAYRLLLSDLIHAAAAGHADACERNGWPL